jgi:Lon protease-like protein
MEAPLAPASMTDEWRSLEIVLRGLESHPHIQRMNLTIDYNNAWEVAFTLIQLLPFDEAIKYELLGLSTLDELIVELDILLNQISGEDG